MARLNIIGSGRVSKTLANLFVANGVFEIGDVCDRSIVAAEEATRFIGAGNPVSEIAAMGVADLWLISVPDMQIAQVADLLAAHSDNAQPAIAVHCSGATEAGALDALRAKGWFVASAHPVLSFADPASAVFQFDGTPCGLEGDEQACSTWGNAMAAIGARCFDIQSDRKKLYHAAAVLASNFLPVLTQMSSELWEHAGIPDELREDMLRTLTRNSIDNLIALGPKDALTGPAARGDVTVISEQVEALRSWDPASAEAYRTLSALAQRFAETGKVQTR
ncbi:Rossmann-like and DUF2520 domain-containing protein [Cupriavidus sp. a3]|uniref:Rossmann-like and DUF2520 domain-containing protein n=1 Tax=Cupriavidus sp. a3 TaxID=3242158 RepID=UPI003D9C34A5